MPVEIRELIIKTTVIDPKARTEEMAVNEKLTAFKQQVVQECIKVMKDKVLKRGLQR
ncbi:MAG: hypothetical protein ING75_03810 [Rhodocyclaceae bacterium]|nr:hypothetical protein [Rhodocyclaceae bacterium]